MSHDGQDWSWEYESHDLSPCAIPDMELSGMTVKTTKVATHKSLSDSRITTIYIGRAWGSALTLTDLVGLFSQI